ncbi:MAG TPA: histidine kinase dimerization/phospho-acceptor domain-containing protein [Blastocatellia bacterium]|nr:histidine kinase dimerization/phospho-acceptor domain-containing protein [Blastocatellia bacterium]
MRSAPKKIRAEKNGLESRAVSADPSHSHVNLESAGFWRQILDRVDESISIHSPTGEILYANQKLLETFGKSYSEVVGSTCLSMFHNAESACPHEQALETNASIECEMTLDEGARVFTVTIAPLRNGLQKAEGYIRLMRNVTEKRRTQEQLLRAEHFATLSQMISGIAHDLGTPLNIISGYSEYLLMRTKPDGQGHKELSTNLQQTRRTANFIRHLLDLARPVQGRKDAIDLKSFFVESLDLMGHHFRKADVKVSVDSKITPHLLYGDAPRLRRAVFNILLNAVGQVGRGGRLELVIDESPQKPGFTMIVLGGVEQDGADHDFSRSFAGFLRGTESEGPMGLGLSLAREVLREFGAEVDSFTVAGRRGPLVVFLPKNNGGQVLAL